MLRFLKFLPLVMMFKDVGDAYQSETGKDRPAVLSRRFIGAVLAIIGAALSIALGVTIDANILSSITESISTIITAGIALWGAVVGIIGIFKAKKSEG